jgi:hypothetical protein
MSASRACSGQWGAAWAMYRKNGVEASWSEMNATAASVTASVK